MQVRDQTAAQSTAPTQISWSVFALWLVQDRKIKDSTKNSCCKRQHPIDLRSPENVKFVIIYLLLQIYLTFFLQWNTKQNVLFHSMKVGASEYLKWQKQNNQSSLYNLCTVFKAIQELLESKQLKLFAKSCISWKSSPYCSTNISFTHVHIKTKFTYYCSTVCGQYVFFLKNWTLYFSKDALIKIERNLL